MFSDIFNDLHGADLGRTACFTWVGWFCKYIDLCMWLRNHNHFAQDVIFSAGDPSVVPFYQDKQCWKTPWLCSVCSPSYPVVSSEVWDEDTVRTAQGSDDFLGRLRIPMAQILQRGAELNQRLEDCTICDTENSPFRHLSSRECWISTCGFGWSFPGHQQGWATRKSMAGSRRAGRLSISWCSLGIRGALESIMSFYYVHFFVVLMRS